jgi:hypothetical protein
MKDFLNYSGEMQETIARQFKQQANGTKPVQAWLEALRQVNPVIFKPYLNYPTNLVAEVSLIAENSNS